MLQRILKMSLQKSSKIILIEFKFLTEEKEDVEELCKKGLADLGYCLNELKGRLSKKVDGQVEKFEEQFFTRKNMKVKLKIAIINFVVVY